MTEKRRVLAGSPHPLGAKWDGKGVNFALFSAHAEKVELCLFDADGRETERLCLPEYTDEIWHGYVPDLPLGQAYGYRVHGAYDPAAGLRFNPHKLLVDPYARGLAGRLIWSDTLFGFKLGQPKQDLVIDTRDNAEFMPKSLVLEPQFDWDNDRPPRTPWTETIVYEVHVKGFSKLHPDVPAEFKGTFKGLSHPSVIEHLVKLGISSVELLPIQAFVDERNLVETGLSNYWGYNPLCYFAPEPRYCTNDALTEFQGLVKALHAANIEVILDVVYNHTAEGNHLGPTLCFKGIDNPSYYMLVEENRRYYENYSGCGNTLKLRHPRVLQMVMDSLRYWVTTMHVDGFRFDLAASLARENSGFDHGSGFLDAVRQDPVLSQVKLIAEPWDIGGDGYRLGAFPPGWSEWNGKYRDSVRKFWRGDGGVIGDLASRLTGSSDIFGWGGRRPWASLNYVTCHDGFTLADLVSFNAKHNWANGEDNRDGNNANYSWNCGVEGESPSLPIKRLRRQQQRNLLGTLLLSQGVPMLLAGDELCHSQGGNNNAYCQDNELSWLDWSKSEDDLTDYIAKLLELRRKHPIFCRPRFYQGRRLSGQVLKDITWVTPEGREMAQADWDAPYARSLGFILSGDACRAEGCVDDDTFMVMMSGYSEILFYTTPPLAVGENWEVILDTARDEPFLSDEFVSAGTRFPLKPHSMAILKRC